MTGPPSELLEPAAQSDKLRPASVAGTAVFTFSAVAAALFPKPLATLSAIVALVLFAVGCVCMLAAFAVAVGRSRSHIIAVGGLYFLAGCAPAPVRRLLMGSLAVEVLVAVATASVRPFTPLAFGVLVPVYGLGMAGLWGAHHGRFPPREEPPKPSSPARSNHPTADQTE
jgi:hypothetical protein